MVSPIPSSQVIEGEKNVGLVAIVWTFVKMITPEIALSIKESVLCWLATVSGSGEPNVSPKEAFCFQDGLILIAHIASPQSIANIESNSQACISFIDIFTQRGFKIRGTAKIVRPEDSSFERFSLKLSEMVGEDHEILAIISIHPIDIEPVLAPSYNIHPETSTKDMIRQSLKTYRITEYQNKIDKWY